MEQNESAFLMRECCRRPGEECNYLISVEGRIFMMCRCFVFSYDPTSDRWTQHPYPGRSYSGMGVWQGKVVLLGGRIGTLLLVGNRKIPKTTDDDPLLRTSVQWTEDGKGRGRWSEGIAAEMVVPCMWPAVAGNTRLLLAVGGLDANDNPLNCVQCYVEEAKRWQLCPPLPVKGCWNTSILVHGEHLYLAGSESLGTEVITADLSGIACYQDQSLLSTFMRTKIGLSTSLTWKKLPNVTFKLSSLCLVDGVLLALGGVDPNSRVKTSSICALTPEDTWRRVGEMVFSCACYSVSISNEELLILERGTGTRVQRGTVKDLKKCLSSSEIQSLTGTDTISLEESEITRSLSDIPRREMFPTRKNSSKDLQTATSANATRSASVDSDVECSTQPQSDSRRVQTEPIPKHAECREMHEGGEKTEGCSEESVKSPVTTSTVKSPVTTSTVKSPVTTSTVKSPVTTSTVKSPVTTSTVKSPGTTSTVFTHTDSSSDHSQIESGSSEATPNPDQPMAAYVAMETGSQLLNWKDNIAKLVGSLVKDEHVSWASRAPVEVVQALSKYQVEVQEHISELLYTERVYLQHLNQMKYLYQLNLARQSILSTQELEQLFPHLEELLQFHDSLCADLKEQITLCGTIVVRNVATTLLQRFDRAGIQKLIRVYSDFELTSGRICNECKINNERFRAFVTETEGHFLSCSLTLKDLMSSVCHRMKKYEALVEPVVKNYLYHVNELDSVEEVYRFNTVLQGIQSVLRGVKEKVVNSARNQVPYGLQLIESGATAYTNSMKSVHPTTIFYKEIELLKEKVITAHEDFSAVRLQLESSQQKLAAAELRTRMAESDLLATREKLEAAEKKVVETEELCKFLKQELVKATDRAKHAIKSLNTATTLSTGDSDLTKPRTAEF